MNRRSTTIERIKFTWTGQTKIILNNFEHIVMDAIIYVEFVLRLEYELLTRWNTPQHQTTSLLMFSWLTNQRTITENSKTKSCDSWKKWRNLSVRNSEDDKWSKWYSLWKSCYVVLIIVSIPRGNPDCREFPGLPPRGFNL